MGCIRVDKITEYLCDPLRKCLKVSLCVVVILYFLSFSLSLSLSLSLSQDEDPYVRKTAAVCVAKLHDINAQLVEEQGFLDLLKELLSDSVPMVTN